MKTKKIFALVAIGIALGLALGYPLSRFSQPTKIVTKTVVQPQVVTNGLSLTDLLARFDLLSGSNVQLASPTTNGIACVAFSGPGSTSPSSPQVGDWRVTVCAKTQ